LMHRRHFLGAFGSLALSAAPSCGRGPSGSAASDKADAGPPADAGGHDGGASDGGNTARPPEKAEYLDGGAPKKGTEDFPDWNHGASSESTSTLLMFRGNALRNFSGTGPLTASPVLKWRFKMGA